ncbi:MAG TPA: helicase-related protein [Ignavibacteriaceae bacterium]|nr:helicase-related protein [Ignavibacteriaceae bacterium]
MYKVVRKKMAESISKVDSPEQYDWNKWLRVPLSDDYYIEPLFSGIVDTQDIILGYTIPAERGFTFDLPKIKISKAFKQLSVQRQKTNKIFFSFPNTLSQSVKEILASARISFSLSVSHSDKGSIYKTSDGQSKQINEVTAELKSFDYRLTSPRTLNFALLLPSKKVSSKEIALFTKPEIIDLLSNLKTEVINVKLLNTENYIDPLKFSESREIKFQPISKNSSVKKIEVVKLDKLLFSLNEQKKLIRKISFPVLSTAKLPAISEIILPGVVKNMLKIMSVKNIKIALPRPRKEIKIDDTGSPEVKDYLFRGTQDQTGGAFLKELEVILQPVLKFGKEEKDTLYDFLYDYQKSAADYLSEYKLALLNDQMGIGKTCEVIGALKILFHKKDISEAIIVTSDFEAGWKRRPSELRNDCLSGWYDHLREFCHGISFGIIENNTEAEWKNPLSVKILNYKTFSEAVEKNLISFNDLSRRGCLVIDEIEDFPEIKLELLPKFVWMLSGMPTADLEKKIFEVTGREDYTNLSRTKSELAGSLRARTRQDYWIEMAPDQKKEYEKALESGRERIYDLVQAGNPFLVQSNVFTLVHQLTQIGNFYGDNDNSPKSEFLLHQLKSIQKCGKKVIILTQYDRQGTQRLEKLFAQNGIKYVLYQTGISLKEMEEAVKKFAKNQSITVFLAGMKAMNAKINFADVPYLIHFDQWWSPVATWQAEDKIISVNEKLNIYNYLIRNSIEDRIRLKLTEKGLLNRKLFDLLNSEVFYSLISNEDWLEILDLIEPKDAESVSKQEKEELQYILNLSTEDFAHKIKALFGRLGYKNFSFKTSHSADEVRLYAIAVKNSLEVKAAVQCLNMKLVTKKIVKEFVDSLVSGTDRIFIFTTGEFDKKLNKAFDNEKIEFIDKYRISNYLNMFNLI